MKPGTRLKSQACDTEVMVIKCGSGQIECGGAPMAEDKPAQPLALGADYSGGTLIGKRYVDTAGAFELLCVKAGKGSLSVDGIVMATKDAKPLPASD